MLPFQSGCCLLPPPHFSCHSLLLTEYWGVGCYTPSCPLLQPHMSTRPSLGGLSATVRSHPDCPREGEEGHCSPIPYSYSEHLGPRQAPAEASSAWNAQHFPGPSLQNPCTVAGVGELSPAPQPSGQPDVRSRDWLEARFCSVPRLGDLPFLTSGPPGPEPLCCFLSACCTSPGPAGTVPMSVAAQPPDAGCRGWRELRESLHRPNQSGEGEGTGPQPQLRSPLPSLPGRFTVSCLQSREDGQ